MMSSGMPWLPLTRWVLIMPRNINNEPLAPLTREDIASMLEAAGLSCSRWQLDLLVQVMNSDQPLEVRLHRGQ